MTKKTLVRKDKYKGKVIKLYMDSRGWYSTNFSERKHIFSPDAVVFAKKRINGGDDVELARKKLKKKFGDRAKNIRFTKKRRDGTRGVRMTLDGETVSYSYLTDITD